MNEFEKESILTAMKKMFRGTHFSICDLDKWIRIAGVIPDARDYNALSALHCVHWSEMSPELRRIVFDKTVSILKSDGFDLSGLDMVFNEETEVFEIPKKKRFKLLG